jgi:hypothetical protein
MNNSTLIAEAKSLIPTARQHVESVAAAHGVWVDTVGPAWPFAHRIATRLERYPRGCAPADLLGAYELAAAVTRMDTHLGLVECCQERGDQVDESPLPQWTGVHLARVQSGVRELQRHLA